MIRLEVNVQTGEQKTITLTPEEEQTLADRAAQAAAELATTKDIRASDAINRIDRLQLIHLFDLENRVRVLEGKAVITVQQYRQALIDRWKTLND